MISVDEDFHVFLQTPVFVSGQSPIRLVEYQIDRNIDELVYYGSNASV